MFFLALGACLSYHVAGGSAMPSERRQQINWYNRYWHDWFEVEDAVYAVAIAHAHYLGYEVYRTGPHEMPPGDPAKIGPVMRLHLIVFQSKRRHGQPTYERFYVDMERRSGKFRPKDASFVSDLSAEE